MSSVGLPWVAQRVWPMPTVPASGSLREPLLQVLELAFGAPARQRAALQRRDAGGVVAAIFQALQRIDELARDRLTPENSNDPAQSGLYPLAATGARSLLSAAARSAEIKMHVRM